LEEEDVQSLPLIYAVIAFTHMAEPSTWKIPDPIPMAQASLSLMTSGQPCLAYVVAYFVYPLIQNVDTTIEKFSSCLRQGVLIALSLRLYRDPGDAPDAELRRYIWLSATIADTLVALMFGRPPLIQREMTDTKCPTAEDYPAAADYELFQIAQRALPLLFNASQQPYQEILKVDDSLLEWKDRAFTPSDSPQNQNLERHFTFIRMALHRKFILYKSERYQQSRDVCTDCALKMRAKSKWGISKNNPVPTMRTSFSLTYGLMILIGMLYRFDPHGPRSYELRSVLDEYFREQPLESWSKREMDILRGFVQLGTDGKEEFANSFNENIMDDWLEQFPFDPESANWQQDPFEEDWIQKLLKSQM
jgi:hypothetical protein